MKKTEYYNDYFNLEEKNGENSPLSFYCRVEKWIDIEEEYGAVPSIIVGRFSKRNQQSITRVADEMLKNIMENLISSDKVKIAINIDNFTDVLYADELEDLVGFYMEANNTNYHFLPSSCKNSTQKYEFIMINDDCKQIRKEFARNNLTVLETMNLNPLNALPGNSSLSGVVSPHLNPFKASNVFASPSYISVYLELVFV